MNIAVYSGSFNPLHIGHLAIIRHMIEEAGFDMVYLIVSPKNPLKDGISSTTGQDRYNAAKEAVERHFNDSSCRVKVDDIELTMDEPHYTIRTLKALREREPENDYTLVIGGDNLASFRKWKDYETILLEFGVAVFPREGIDCKAEKMNLTAENQSYRIRLIDAPLVNISSTEIRNSITAGQDMSMWLM